jgi:AraC-like DNA-binding protein
MLRIVNRERLNQEELVRLRRVRDLMDRWYAVPLDVPTMAHAVLMSPSHFAPSVPIGLRRDVVTYLMTRRIERAMALLRRGDLTVTEVCLAVGASSLGSFSVRFTELVGQSPSAYRAAQRADPVAAVVRMGGSDTTQQNLVRDVDALVAAFMSDAPLDDIVPLVDRIATAAEYWDDIPDRAIIELRSAII